MTIAEKAKVFCRMSFYPSFFPCVESDSAAKIFNFMTFSDFTQEDFHDFLVEIFGVESDAGNSIFRLARTKFYQSAYVDFYDHNGKAFNEYYRRLENVCDAYETFEGGEIFEIHSG